MKNGVKCQPPRERQIRFQQAQRFSLREHFDHRGKSRQVD